MSERRQYGHPVEGRAFTFCSAYYGGCAWHEFLIMTPSRPEAKQRAEAYAVAKWGEGWQTMHLYPRKYVKQARSLYARGLHD